MSNVPPSQVLVSPLLLGLTLVSIAEGGGPIVGLDQQLDVIGGYASTHIIVRFAPGAVDVQVLGNDSKHSEPRGEWNPPFGGARAVVLGAPAGLSAELGATCHRWGVTRMRRLYAGGFGNPEAAARYGLDRTYILEVPAGTDTAAMAAACAGYADEIEVAAVDAIGTVAELIPNDADFVKQYGMHNTGQTVNGNPGTPDADIDAPEAWAIHTGDLGTVTVAIIDTGVSTHPEFVGRMVPGINTVGLGDFTTDTTDGCPHGTHVAGIAAAEGNNGIGVAGVTWGANVMPVRVFFACFGAASDLAEGIIWAVDNGADVCNISLQFCSGTQAMEDAVNYAHDNGVLVVSAAGNNNFLCPPSDSNVRFPAKFPNSMAVSATNNDDELAFFSNIGNELDVAAPGELIWSTWINNSYNFLNGTSQATPFVSGLAALIKSSAPQLTADEVRSIITTTADDLGPVGWDNNFGFGRINAHKALPTFECIPSQAPEPELTPNELGVLVESTKNRFLSFRAVDVGRSQAVRVTFMDLPPPFDSWNGFKLWAGEPKEVSENAGAVNPADAPGALTFNAAILQCDGPVFRDWNVLGTVHLFHEGIVPGGRYLVQVVNTGCLPQFEFSFSAPLEITQAQWGDSVKNCATFPCPPPDGVTNILDVLALVDKFVNAPTAIIKARADLEPGCLNLVVDILDVLRAVDAFLGLPYPFAPSAPLNPCASTCPNPLPAP